MKDFKDTLSEIQEKYSGLPWNVRTSSAKFLLGGYACISFLNKHKVTFGATTLLISVGVSVPFTSQYNRTDYFPTPIMGSGGPDFTVLGYGFSYPDTNYTCDEGVWGINSNSHKTIVYYGQGTSTPLGSIFQFDFIPTGRHATNLAIGRPELYEIMPGNNTFDVVSVKDLRSGDFISLKTASGSRESFKGIRLEDKVSTSSLNTIRIEENISSKFLVLTIAINNEVLVSEKILISDLHQHKSLYFALLDMDKQNETGIIFPELTICSDLI
jgi:hypothetical protein